MQAIDVVLGFQNVTGWGDGTILMMTTLFIDQEDLAEELTTYLVTQISEEQALACVTKELY